MLRTRLLDSISFNIVRRIRYWTLVYSAFDDLGVQGIELW